jgi:hypothetical protein
MSYYFPKFKIERTPPSPNSPNRLAGPHQPASPVNTEKRFILYIFTTVLYIFYKMDVQLSNKLLTSFDKLFSVLQNCGLSPKTLALIPSAAKKYKLDELRNLLL